ncbi:EthD domain-containing protein [Variovorax sp. J22R133]|uniref:EthD domain-containing protein n=1 Tax=Variovorax brevis TaxID=3053503 RepID=UPI00257602AF|nr:EthD domain-containing protein [Variovorax sp. J22R133]MDM0116112.1 EthD domain-containing protein [Variovorax sp. J22R133]
MGEALARALIKPRTHCKGLASRFEAPVRPTHVRSGSSTPRDELVEIKPEFHHDAPKRKALPPRTDAGLSLPNALDIVNVAMYYWSSFDLNECVKQFQVAFSLRGLRPGSLDHRIVNNMIKRLSLLKRRADLTADRFAEHWAGPHAQIALQMGGICKYTQNRVRGLIAQRADAQGTFAVDGVVELYFVDEAAMAEAGTTETVKRLLPEDEHRFLSGITLTLPTTEGTPGSNASTKVMLVASRRTGSDEDAFQAEVRAWVSQLPHAESIVLDWIRQSYHRTELWHDPVDPDVIASIWLAGGSSTLDAFSETASASLSQATTIGRASLLLVDPLRIV